METILYFSSLILTFALTVIAARIAIPILRSHKMGQKILDIGPRWHKSKEGTPTMGGVAFIIPMMIIGVIAAVILWITDGAAHALPLLFTLGFALLCALIGLVDDSAKLRKKQNEGLTAKQKYLLQLIAAALYLAAMVFSGAVSTVLYIPFFNFELELGIFYYVFAMLFLTGIVNGVNLTDGLDGLASSVTLVIGIFLTLAGFFSGMAVGGSALAVLGGVIIGGTLGFLVYNFYPARVFMGDTGSLFLGALVIGSMFMLNNPLLVVIVGFIFIVEIASVILQVGYFKLTHGKRLFKMAPIHHHFEKCGMSEVAIVAMFSAITAVCCAIAWFGLK